jgi:hypothetical protein
MVPLSFLSRKQVSAMAGLEMAIAPTLVATNRLRRSAFVEIDMNFPLRNSQAIGRQRLGTASGHGQALGNAPRRRANWPAVTVTLVQAGLPVAGARSPRALRDRHRLAHATTAPTNSAARSFRPLVYVIFPNPRNL